MRICYLANSAIPSANASSIQIVKMCEAFVNLNHEVLLITTKVSNKNIFNFYDVRSKFNYIRLKKFTKFPLGIKYYLFSIFSILESFRFKPEIYITRNFFTCFLLTALKKKTILELHHDVSDESRVVRFLVKKLNFLNSSYIIKLIAITKYAKKNYVSKYLVKENKIIVLPSGSSISKNFTFFKNKKKFNIGYFGSLYKSRGSNIIINLAKIDRGNNYFMYGKIDQLDKLNSIRNIKNLEIKDYISYKKIPKILSKMDILLMPYTSKITAAGDYGDITNFTSPLKLFDYLSVGRVILCSNYSVLYEVLKDNKNAIFVKNFKNVFAWKMELKRLVNQKTKIMIMSKNNYKHSKKYSHNRRGQKIINIIETNLKNAS